ncbi:MAG TPA: hypothetical protein PLD18_05665 [Flavobacterium sp.]|nr:hypothetical protein [Flavobacterium sp.]HRA72750.1 hypothetical protein [Flavobacterium sp.]
MKTTKKLGIWMDYSTANLIEYKLDSYEIKSINSGFSNQEKNEVLDNSKSLINNNENQQLSNYFRRIGEQIKEYNELVLFGSTNAKIELHAILKEEKPFQNIKIEIKNTDKMTDNQKKYFVKSYFSEV